MQGLISVRVAECAARICAIAGVDPKGPAGEWIAEQIQECCEAELDVALDESEAVNHA